MNNEEIITTNNDMIETVTDTELDYENYEDVGTSSGVLGKVLLGAAVGVGGVAALVYKNRNKILDWRIKRLEKKGYKVEKIETPVEDAEAEHVDAEVVDNEGVLVTDKKKKNKKQ